MCGRYALATGAADLAAAFRAVVVDAPTANWNVSPSQVVSMLVSGVDGRRELTSARWGIEAPWSDRGLVINARSETVGSKALFARLLHSGRCAVPMDGYYEWRRSGGRGPGSRTPFHVRPRREGSLDLGGVGAALGVHDRSAGRLVVLTRSAPERVATIHDRMPFLAGRPLLEAWIRGEASPEDLETPPPPDDDLEFWEVGPAVNSSRSAGAGLLDPPGVGGLFG